MIVERIKELLKIENLTYHDLAKATNVNAGKWAKCLNGHNVLKWEEVEEIIKIYPEYAYWLATGLEQPEVGNISPATKRTQQELNKVGKAG